MCRFSENSYIDELLSRDLDQKTFFELMENVFGGGTDEDYTEFWPDVFKHLLSRAESYSKPTKESSEESSEESSDCGRIMTLLGWLYDQGFGTKQDPIEAYYWYKRAEKEFDDVNALCEIAMNYIRGERFETNYDKAEHYAKKLDERKYRYAKYVRGQMCEKKGEYSEALEYYVRNYVEDQYPGVSYDIQNCMKHTNPSDELIEYVKKRCPDDECLCEYLKM